MDFDFSEHIHSAEVHHELKALTSDEVVVEILDRSRNGKGEGGNLGTEGARGLG